MSHDRKLYTAGDTAVVFIGHRGAAALGDATTADLFTEVFPGSRQTPVEAIRA